MTKRNLLLVSLFLVFGLVGMATSALAQTQWTFGTNVRIGGRPEGEKEATGQVTLQESGQTNSVAAGTGFTIYYNAPIVAGSVILECTSGSGGPWPTTAGNPCSSEGLTYAIGTGTGISYSLGSAAPNQLYVNFGTTTNFTASASSQISITVRVNASQAVAEPVPLGGSGYPACGEILALGLGGTPSSTENLSISTNNNVNEPVLQLDCEPVLSLAIADPDTAVKVSGGKETSNGVEATVLTCIGVKEVASYTNNFCLNVDEEYVHALTTESFEWSLDPGTASPGSVNSNTQVIITFWNVPSGVSIASKNITPCSAFSASNTSDGCNASGYTGTLNLSFDSCVANTGAQTVTCTYETATMDNGRKESVDICYRFWSDGPLPPASYAQISATIQKGPLSPPTDTPLFNGVKETGQHPNVVIFYNCDTNLLYPFVTNYLAGGSNAYDNLGTEIFVANTTWDPLATSAAVAINPQEQEGTATPQSGACTFWLFPNATTTGFADGSANSGGPYMFTSPTIAAGGTYGFDLGSVNSGEFAGMTGYVYAKCQFQNAHGVEYITDNYALGEPGNSFAFQAIVIPTPEFYHRTPAGDGLGESAVAPIAVSKYIQKAVFFGVHNGAGY